MSQAVLYRKYRPVAFDQVVGQDHIVSILQDQIKTDKLAHAYLFCGPRGTGKTSTARIFAREINQINTNEEIDSSLDIVEIDAASNRGVDQIRQLRDSVSFVPSQLKYKVYIIDEVHMLTKEAFNALLKTLEEPPKHIIFLLATTEPHKLPITVLSRVLRFDFRLANQKDLMIKIQKILDAESIQIDQEAIDEVCKIARGSFRDTESMLQKILTTASQNKINIASVRQALGISNSNQVNQFLSQIHEGNADKAFDIFSQIQKNGSDTQYFLIQVLEQSRVELQKCIQSKNTRSQMIKLTQIIEIFANALKDAKMLDLGDVLYYQAISKACLTHNHQSKETSQLDNEQKAINPVKKSNTEISKPERTLTKVPVNQQESSVPDTYIPPNPAPKIENPMKLWVEFLEKVKKYNFHIAAFLHKANIEFDTTESKFLFTVAFEFHKKKLTQKESQDIIYKAMQEVWQVKLIYDVVVNKDLKPKAVEIAKQSGTNSNNKELVEQIFNF